MLISRFNLLDLQGLSKDYYLNKIGRRNLLKNECLHDTTSKTRVQTRADFEAN